MHGFFVGHIMATDKKQSDRVSIDRVRPDSTSERAAPTRRPYQAPRVLSAEALEAAAATCDPPAGGVGKFVPACNPSTIGS